MASNEDIVMLLKQQIILLEQQIKICTLFGKGFSLELTEILKNRKMIIESTFTPFLEIPEIKSKIEKMQEEYSMIETGINRLNELWDEFAKEKGKESMGTMGILIGRLQEIMEMEVYPHMERFTELSEELWGEYLKWRKSAENKL